MSFIRVNGGVAHYRDEGPRDAPVIAFINALGSDLRIWDEVVPLLNADFRVIRYDKRGHGLSESGADRYDMADFAGDLSGLLDRLSIARATIVGLSIGGVIALETHRLRPDLFASLVLADTAAKIGTKESWGQRIAAIEAGGIEAIADSLLEKWFTAGFRMRRPDDLAGWRAMLTRTPKQAYLAACGALGRADLRPHAVTLALPTLCLVGSDDGSTPVALVRETASMIPEAQFEIVADAAHIVCLEQANVVARLLAAHAQAGRRDEG